MQNLSYTKLSIAIGVGIGLIAPLFDFVIDTIWFIALRLAASAAAPTF